jgi:hypothetical protein
MIMPCVMSGGWLWQRYMFGLSVRPPNQVLMFEGVKEV